MRISVVPLLTALVGLLAGPPVFAQTGVTLTPQQVSLAAPTGSTIPATQALSLTTTGGSAPFTALVRYFGSASGWLTVTPSAGNTPASLGLSADASKLAAGSYFAQVTVQAGPLATYANVLFTVGGGGNGGSLVANPNGLTFIGQTSGSAPLTQTISVTNGKGLAGAVRFTALASSTGWLSVSPFPFSTPTQLTVQVDPAGLGTGTYSGAITLLPTAGGNPTVIPVTLAATASSAIKLVLSQNAVTVNYQTGTPVPSNQPVDVDTPGFALSYTASTTTPWIQLLNQSNPTPSNTLTGISGYDGIGIRANPSGLVPGTYTGSVTVSSPGLTSRELPVTLNVTTQAVLNSEPSSVQFDTNIGLTQRNVIVSSGGSGSLSFTTSVNSNGGWLRVTPTSGTISGFTTLTLTADATGLSGGTYDGAINVIVTNGSGQTFTIPVSLTVGSGIGSVGPLELETRGVELTGVVGLPNASRTINIGSSLATQKFTASATSSEGWLQVDPFNTTAPGKITLTANSAAVPTTGVYSGIVTLTSLSTGLQDTINVNFNYQERAITSNPPALAIRQFQWGTTPASQTIQITGNVPSTYTAKSSASWLTITPQFGSTPGTITVSANPAGLAPGVVNGNIEITGPNNVLRVPVSFTLAEAPGPNVSPATITVNHQLGSPTPAPISIGVTSTGPVLGFTAIASTDSGVKWLTITPASGTTPANVTATVNPDLVTPGQHTGSIKVSSVDGLVQRTIPVTLNVTTSGVSVLSILNSATFAPTALAPGQIISITGTALGPTAGIAAKATSAGAIETKLADVRVLVDGVPAPLLYVRYDQINAIVPYAVYGRISAKVQVETSGTNYSIPVEVKVVDSAPGIFSVGSTGKGQAAALNSDGSVNSMANPAVRGGYVSIFGTGEGQTDPQGQDGRIIITDLRRPLLPVTATVGGKPATVTYFGSAPQLVSGVFQANIRIPEDIPAGAAVLEIQVGSAKTQTDVTIAVK